MILKFKRLFRRLRCKHLNRVWLHERFIGLEGGDYPARCCLDCGKLNWAVMTSPGTYRFLNPELIAASEIHPPKSGGETLK